MLVLSRKAGESIRMSLPGGDPITVTICDVGGGDVSVGITAPAEVLILREELVGRRVQAAADAGRLHELEEAMDREENQHRKGAE